MEGYKDILVFLYTALVFMRRDKEEIKYLLCEFSLQMPAGIISTYSLPSALNRYYQTNDPFVRAVKFFFFKSKAKFCCSHTT
jgi:hypothetical protein